MQDEEQPIDREAWRRALGGGAGEPPRATDLRIRAEARRALAPPAGRWWLPASLAASLLLAVLIVQWQYDAMRAPAPVTESDVAPAEASMPPAAADATAPAPAPVAEPRRLPAATPAAAPVADGLAPAAAAPAPKSESPSAVGVAARQELMRAVAAEEMRAPEDWYAQIEELRASGRIEEAQAELDKLEAAYPGWVERHLAGQR